MKVCVMIDSCVFDATHLLSEPSVCETYSLAPVGAGHARDQAARGHGPLLQVFKVEFCKGPV
jgi:hypothetical protein